MTPVFAEDSTPVILAPTVEKLLGSLSVNSSNHDYVVAFLIVLMAETGYRVSCLYDPSQRLWSEDVTIVPENWKSKGNENYEIVFLLYQEPTLGLKLIASPLGNLLILNLLPKGPATNCKARSITIDTSKYVNIYIKDQTYEMWHMKELALRFKDNLSGPLHAEMLYEFGIVSPSLQGLPEDMQLRIISMLDCLTLKRLSSTCKAFRNLCDPLIKSYMKM